MFLGTMWWELGPWGKLLWTPQCGIISWQPNRDAGFCGPLRGAKFKVLPPNIPFWFCFVRLVKLMKVLSVLTAVPVEPDPPGTGQRLLFVLRFVGRCPGTVSGPNTRAGRPAPTLLQSRVIWFLWFLQTFLNCGDRKLLLELFELCGVFLCWNHLCAWQATLAQIG